MHAAAVETPHVAFSLMLGKYEQEYDPVPNHCVTLPLMPPIISWELLVLFHVKRFFRFCQLAPSLVFITAPRDNGRLLDQFDVDSVGK